ncbi:unnamed protein product [Nyctereutes procyonoides]|uniref:Vomeronasal type-1 receptor n=1 Tax=Nyctereutes procyonoides TaxID=34880 RepID=A0A811ZU83_NYCPR|nr:unnamed protein product [Nyctereutes procyonoides]
MVRFIFAFFPTKSTDFEKIQQPLDINKMGSGKLELGIIFLTQTGIGILGNSSLLCFYTFSLFTGHKLRPINLILCISVVLFSKGIPQMMVAFGSQYFLDDAASGSSLCIWMELKIRSPKFIGFCFLCWIPHLLIISYIRILVNGPLISKNDSVKINGYYS